MITSLLADNEYVLPAVFTLTPIAVFLSSKIIFFTSVLWYTCKVELLIACCRNDVSEELRVSASASMVEVNSENPSRFPLLNPAMLFSPNCTNVRFMDGENG